MGALANKSKLKRKLHYLYYDSNGYLECFFSLVLFCHTLLMGALANKSKLKRKLHYLYYDSNGYLECFFSWNCFCLISKVVLKNLLKTQNEKNLLKLKFPKLTKFVCLINLWKIISHLVSLHFDKPSYS